MKRCPDCGHQHGNDELRCVQCQKNYVLKTSEHIFREKKPNKKKLLEEIDLSDIVKKDNRLIFVPTYSGE